jgi:formate transporter
MAPDDRRAGLPAPQYLSAEHVVGEMAEHGVRRIRSLSVVQILMLAMMGGGFVTVGALFSVLLATGVEAPGAERLLEGLGFSAGFFVVILSQAVLFTEANVVLPATLLGNRGLAFCGRLARFWALAWVGNLLGAFLVGAAVHLAQHYPDNVSGLLGAVIERKLQYRAIGGIGAWGQIVLSGVLANWLVGMAAFFAVMGRTIFGRYIPVFLAVTLFVAANFQHSPANMGFFALATPQGIGPGWATALGWNIIPAGIGNMLGGSLLVALPFWYTLRPSERTRVTGERGESSGG